MIASAFSSTPSLFPPLTLLPSAKDTKVTPTLPVKSFVLSGRAYFTLESKRSGTHYAYRVAKHKTDNVWFVGVLSGTAGRDYHYIGVINDKGQFFHTKGSRLQATNERVVAFSWFWKKASAGPLPDSLGFYHQNKCCKCGRALTDPESIARGIGPVCSAYTE